MILALASGLSFLTFTPDRPKYYDTQAMNLDIQAVTGLQGEPAVDWLANAVWGATGQAAALVDAGPGHWTYASPALHALENDTLQVSLYLEPSNLSAEWRLILSQLNSRMADTQARLRKATAPLEVAQLNRDAADQARLKAALLQIILQNELPVSVETFAPVVVLDVNPPALSDLTLTDAAGHVLANGAVTASSSLTVTWNATDEVAALCSATVNGAQAPVTDLGSGHFQTSVDLSSLAEGPVAGAVQCHDLAGNTSTLPFNVIIDRTPPVLVVRAPADCVVSRQASILSVSGLVTEAHLNQLSVTLTNSAFPQGVSQSLSVNAGAFNGSVTLAQGDNLMVFQATDAAGLIAQRFIQAAYFPPGALYPFFVSASSADQTDIAGQFTLNGAPVVLPANMTFTPGATQTFSGLAQDQAIGFQLTPDPGFHYVYDVNAKALQSIPDGCNRTIQILFPSTSTTVPTQFGAEDPSGNPIQEVTFSVDGVPTSNGSATLPGNSTFTLTVNYGISQGEFQVPGGVQPDQTVVVDFATGTVQRVSTPGQSGVTVRLNPLTALFENDSMDGTFLDHAVSLLGQDGALTPLAGGVAYPFADGSTLSLETEHGGFYRRLTVTAKGGQDYQFAVQGNRTWLVPHPSGSVANAAVHIAFFYQLAPVALGAIDESGNAVSVEVASTGVNLPLSATTPATDSLGLASNGALNIGLNGFFKAVNATVQEDEEVVQDLLTETQNLNYSFGHPKLTWKVNPINVRFEVVNSSGVPLLAQVGIDAPGRPSGPAPQTLTLLEGTSGPAFAQWNSGRATGAPTIHFGMDHIIEVSSGHIKVEPDPTGATVVRFVF